MVAVKRTDSDMNGDIEDLLNLDDSKKESKLSVADLKEQVDKVVHLLKRCNAKGPQMRIGDIDVWRLGSFEIKRRIKFDNVYENTEH